ncbi:SLBB domain-containing protein [Pseudothermotoga sp.]|nr:SLBB domain-containing protein [Pseudothermotoga sp.]MDW8140510.1 SLBB domain-containing protein [Pseudothermotoga sp.]
MHRVILVLCLVVSFSFVFSYTLRKGDVLRIELFNIPDYTRECVVDIEGKIALPIVGRLSVEGLTIDELVKILRQKLSTQVSDSNVIVTLLRIAPRNVYVSGIVNGVVDMGMKDLKVSELLALLSVNLSEVELTRIKLVRGGTVKNLDLSALLFGDVPKEDPTLKENDQIVLPGKLYSDFVKILGAVKNPGVYPFKKNMTLLDIISTAGGITEDSAGRILIVSDSIQEINEKDLFNNIVMLKPGDTVYVAKIEERFAYIMGAVAEPGMYVFSKGEDITLKNLIAKAGGFSVERKFLEKVVVRRNGVVFTELNVDNDVDMKLQVGDVVEVKKFEETEVYIFGYVKNPGAYEISPKEKFTLRKMISLAGGFAGTIENIDRIVVERENEKIELSSENLDFLVKPGDVIRIEEYVPRRAYILGFVKNPGLYSFSKNETFSLRTLVAKAGGFTSDDSVEFIKVGEEIYAPSVILKEDVPLKDGATVYVEKLKEQFVYVVGDNLARNGRLTFERSEPFTLSTVLKKYGVQDFSFVKKLSLLRRGEEKLVDTVSLLKKDIDLEIGDTVIIRFTTERRVYFTGDLYGYVTLENEEQIDLEKALAKFGRIDSKYLQSLKIRSENRVLQLTTVSPIPLKDGDIVEITLKKPIRVYVDGFVGRPGQFVFDPDETPTIEKVIAKAGGFKESGTFKEKDILLLRSGKETVIDLDRITNVLLQDGDFLFVRWQEKPYVYVLGEVAKPGVYELREGESTLIEIVSRAGGLSDWAMKTKVVLRRGQSESTYDLSDLSTVQNIKVKSGDLIYVPSIDTNIAYVLGNVRNPSIVKIDRFTTVFDAIMRAGGLNQTASASRIFLFKGGLEGEVIICDLSGIITGKGGGTNPTISPGDVVYVPTNPLAQLPDILPVVRDILSIITASKQLMGW